MCLQEQTKAISPRCVCQGEAGVVCNRKGCGKVVAEVVAVRLLADVEEGRVRERTEEKFFFG